MSEHGPEGDELRLEIIYKSDDWLDRPRPRRLEEIPFFERQVVRFKLWRLGRRNRKAGFE